MVRGILLDRFELDELKKPPPTVLQRSGRLGPVQAYGMLVGSFHGFQLGYLGSHRTKIRLLKSSVFESLE